MANPPLTISEVAQLLGIHPKTIRHYHEVGVLPEPARAENGYRCYNGADVLRIQRIRELQGYGLSLRQIGYILSSDEPDAHLHAFLVQRDADLAEEIHRLQRQQARIQAWLRGEAPGPPAAPSHDILEQIIRPSSSGLADVLMAVEGAVLAQVDRLNAEAGYARFWEDVALAFLRLARPHEHQLILWLERYLALGAMSADDRQGQAWLYELHVAPDARLLYQALELPPSEALPAEDQQHIRRLIPLLLYEQSNPLQRAFLEALNQRRNG